ncbi:hypothetical protein V2J09_000217 [Rumex salicifolius]
MQQPRKPNQLSSSSSSISPMQPPPEEKKKAPLPTPQELISHYESQGMDSQQASFKVIDDLQNMLVRVISSSSSSKSVKAKKNKFMSDASRKLDTANARLAILEMKLDSKPGFPQSLAIGVASGATFRGLSSVWPHISTAAVHV